MTNLPEKSHHLEIILYQTEDGKTRVQVRLQDETVWLTQANMAELFQTTPQNLTLHLKNIYQEGELAEEATCKDFLQVQTEGSRQIRRNRRFYNLDAIISVGYRVKFHRGTQFRIWATQRLREYIVKGFTLDDERLKQAGGGNYIMKISATSKTCDKSEMPELVRANAGICPVLEGLKKMASPVAHRQMKNVHAKSTLRPTANPGIPCMAGYQYPQLFFDAVPY